MVDVYRELSEIATNAGVRVSTHHYHLPDRLLWNYDTMSRLLNEVQSPVHGVTYCQGKSQMAGDDLVSDILNYGEQIFMFHIRDVITRVSNDMPPEVEKRLMDIGYLEVAFGTGEVDMVGCIRALKQINYQGQIYPEHFPAIAGDRAAGVAWTIGYIRGDGTKRSNLNRFERLEAKKDDWKNGRLEEFIPIYSSAPAERNMTREINLVLSLPPFHPSSLILNHGRRKHICLTRNLCEWLLWDAA